MRIAYFTCYCSHSRAMHFAGSGECAESCPCLRFALARPMPLLRMLRRRLGVCECGHRKYAHDFGEQECLATSRAQGHYCMCPWYEPASLLFLGGQIVRMAKLLPTVARAVPRYVWPIFAAAALIKCFPLDFGIDETLFVVGLALIVRKRPGLVRVLWREASAGKAARCACPKHRRPELTPEPAGAQS